MKKILGLLGTITISGSGVSGIIGNAPTSAKNEINYSQTNNLKRSKRYIKQNNITRNNIVIPIGILQKDSNCYRKAGDMYVGTTNGLYLKYVGTHNIKKIDGIEGLVTKIDIDPYGGAFVTTNDGNFYFINCDGETVRGEGLQTFILNKGKVISTGILQKNSTGNRKAGDMYVGTTNGLYLKYVGTHDIKKIDGINESVTSINIDFDGGAFITTITGNLYYIDINGNSTGIQSYIPGKIISTIKENLNSIIFNKNISLFKNNSNEAILNELNYLNSILDISQLEIINKNDNYAIVKAKENSINYVGNTKIYYSITNDIEKNIINLNELIKKGIFLSFRDKNQGILIKEIKNINTDDLIYSNITVKKSIEPIYTKNNKSICFGTTTLFHNLPEKQNMKTPGCKYTKETTISTQITKGLSKEETNSKTSDIKHNWNFELGVTVKGEAGVWPFAKVSTEINTKIGTGGEYGSSETKTLSNKFDFSNIKTEEYKESLEVELPSQEINVKPNQKIKVTASLNEILAQVTLNLKQNIYGEITSQITNANNEKISFKISINELMQKLQQYNLLPQEITINNDDSITFNGKANRSLKQGFDGNIAFHEVK